MMLFELSLAIDHKAAEVPVVVAGSLKSAARGSRWRPRHDVFWLHSVPDVTYTEADKRKTFHLSYVANESNLVCVLQKLYHLVLLRAGHR